MDGAADPLICPASADVASHSIVDIGIGRFRFFGKQRGDRHDLAGLAVAALGHLFRDPYGLQ